MNGDRHLDVVSRESANLVLAVRADVDAHVRRYRAWTVADLGRHVGQIHRWVAGIVDSRAAERPPRPEVSEVADTDLPAWITSGATELVDVLGRTAPEEHVWTFSPHASTVGFWRRRMALETTLHRWDAEDAVSDPGPVSDWLALEGVDEALNVYLAVRLEGTGVGGAGEGLLLDCGSRLWSVMFHRDRIQVSRDRRDVRATVEAPPLDMWLLLTRRRSLDGLSVEGERPVLDMCIRAVNMVPGPARPPR